MFNAKRILVPVDFSAESKLALDWAIMLAKENPGACIELYYVLPEVFVPVVPEAGVYDYARMGVAEQKAAEAKLQRFQSLIPRTIPSTGTVGQGRVTLEIERLCKEKQFDLIVMTTRDRRGMARFLHGSITEEVTRLAPCPVLVLHLNPLTRAAAKVA